MTSLRIVIEVYTMYASCEAIKGAITTVIMLLKHSHVFAMSCKSSYLVM